MEPARGSPLFLVVRPNDARHAPRSLRAAVEAAGVPFAFEPVRGLLDLPRAIDDALAAGHADLAIAGSDAAFSRAADVLLARGAAREVRLAVIPAGLSRDIAVSLGITSLSAAVAAALRVRPRPLDAGRVHAGDGAAASHLVVAAGAGWLPPPASEVAAPLRRLSRDRGRIITAALRLAKSPSRSFTLSIDALEHDGRYSAVSIHNLPRWQGGLVAAPGASPSDGLLDVLRWGVSSRRGLLKAIRGQAEGGHHVVHEGIERSPGRVIELSSPRPTTLFADGRPVGPLPARIESLAGALTVLAPPDP
jgi:diacylglycerol kinase (ATP)